MGRLFYKTSIVFLFLILLGGCGSGTATDNTIGVYKGPVYEGIVKADDTECTYADSPGMYSCSNSPDDGIFLYPNLDGIISYCITDNCDDGAIQLDFPSNKLNTPFMKAPKGSNKIDMITTAIYDLWEYYGKEADITSIVELVAEMTGAELPSNYLTNNQNITNDKDIAVLNYAVQDAVEQFISLKESGSTDENAKTTSKALYETRLAQNGISSSSTFEDIESKLLSKLSTEESISYEEVDYTPPTEVETEEVTLAVNATADITVNSTLSNVTATSSDTSIATASVNSSVVTITAVASGDAVIYIKNDGATIIVVNVTVTSSTQDDDDDNTSTTVEETTASVTQGSTTDVSLDGITGTITVTTSSSATVTVSVSSNTLTLSGISVGSATVEVSSDGVVVKRIAVTVLAQGITDVTNSYSIDYTSDAPPSTYEQNNYKIYQNGSALVIDFSDYAFGFPSVKVSQLYDVKYGNALNNINNTATISGLTATISTGALLDEFYLSFACYADSIRSSKAIIKKK